MGEAHADVHEHVLAAIFRCDKAVAFCFVEPFYGASGLPVVSYKNAAHNRWQPGQRIGKIESKTPVKEKRGR